MADVFAHYHAYLRDMTRDRAQVYFKDAAILVSDIPATEQVDVHGHWVAMIIVAGSGMKTTLKTHFFSAPICSHLAQRNGNGTPPVGVSHDFIKEFLNLCAGQIKARMGDQRIDVGISLPCLM